MEHTGTGPGPGTADLDLPIPLERDIFLRNLLRHLAGTLEDVVGLEEARGFITLVGQQVAEWLDPAYREAYGVDYMDLDQMANALVDLKRRIRGGFSIEECTPERIVYVNTDCPFGEFVRDRPSLCMMTSTVFGTIAAENLGYAKVALEETIARGADGCRVVVYLRDTADAQRAQGLEYFSS